MAAARIYLDHNATSPIRPEVLSAVGEALACGGNPSSVHAEGRAARALVEHARAQVAALVGARPEDVVFTSGGTEANNMALRPGALRNAAGQPAERFACGAAEHPSVLQGHGFGQIEAIPVDRTGRVDLAALEAMLDGAVGQPALFSLQVANSETGVIQPVAEAAALVRARGGIAHADAVQAAGRMPLDMATFGLDALTLSGHKLGAPAGIGALVFRPGRAGPNLPLVRGGGQESRARAGTENLAGIVGFGVAAEMAARDLAAEGARQRRLRDCAEQEVRRLAPDAVVFGEGADRLPNTLAFAVPGLSAETALMALDLAGIAVSSGSACSSGKVGRSHVLAAMGVPDALARGAIRVSFGWNSREDDVLGFARAFETLLRRLYEPGRARAA
ncbi:cysteine desulfurase family protein [Enterovirga aerilata]|uniref:Cysteine desulfurase n=1 Tax=Enterovirga aerilata TaxID=2730920 RepID=A0A849I7I0_9HYPH|nr:cysteine desulfurase family protein [Enterovirga sp. DB1703]NNM73338.1 cysteine desulfurase [Enterovirga sp. DB1703]